MSLAEFLQPWLTALATIIVPALIGWAVVRFSQLTGIQFTAAQLSIIEKASGEMAGVLAAKADDNLAHTTIDATHPMVMRAATELVAVSPQVKQAMDDLGLSPSNVAHSIAAAIGNAQMSQTRVETPLILHTDGQQKGPTP